MQGVSRNKRFFADTPKTDKPPIEILSDTKGLFHKTNNPGGGSSTTAGYSSTKVATINNANALLGVATAGYVAGVGSATYYFKSGQAPAPAPALQQSTTTVHTHHHYHQHNRSTNYSLFSRKTDLSVNTTTNSNSLSTAIEETGTCGCEGTPPYVQGKNSSSSSNNSIASNHSDNV